MADSSHPAQRSVQHSVQSPASDPLPDGLTADAPPAVPLVRAESPGTPEPARTPDEYLETPGSHRRPDGAATDVGA